MWNMPVYGEWVWASMAVMMFLVWVPALALVAWVVTRLSRTDVDRSKPTVTSAPARELLDRRYAAGELNRDQYLQMATDLDTGQSAAATQR
jgi:putative membrane protein